jgi:bifunctional non-homologous end joining protein LigD
VAKDGAIEVAGVRMTHPGKVLYADAGIAKRDLAAYYESVAERILPHVSDRPLTLLRCPEGGAKDCFFQKHAAGSEPDAIGVIEVQEAKKRDTYLVVRDLAGLVGLVQLGTLEIHVWGSRRDRVDRPDRMVVDLDPGVGAGLGAVVAAAREVRARLDELGLRSFVMTTGGKGLHVVLPLRRRHDFDVVHAFARDLAKSMERDRPDRYVAEASKAKRRDVVFVDYLRNGRGATAICPYSTRRHPGAPVATPLRWDELARDLRPERYRVATLARRLAGLREDPWAGYDTTAQSLSREMRAHVAQRSERR